MKTLEYYAKIVSIGIVAMACGVGLTFIGVIFGYIFAWLLGLGITIFGFSIGTFGYIKWVPLFYQKQRRKIK